MPAILSRTYANEIWTRIISFLYVHLMPKDIISRDSRSCLKLSPSPIFPVDVKGLSLKDYVFIGKNVNCSLVVPNELPYDSMIKTLSQPNHGVASGIRFIKCHFSKDDEILGFSVFFLIRQPSLNVYFACNECR